MRRGVVAYLASNIIGRREDNNTLGREDGLDFRVLDCVHQNFLEFGSSSSAEASCGGSNRTQHLDRR